LLTGVHLLLLYVGRGTSVRDVSGDEALVFDDGNIVDDDLISRLVRYKNQRSVLTLLADARQPDVIWNMVEKVRN
jgi:dTDP-D-glucose 4,6-dehydratase